MGEAPKAGRILVSSSRWYPLSVVGEIGLPLTFRHGSHSSSRSCLIVILRALLCLPAPTSSRSCPSAFLASRQDWRAWPLTCLLTHFLRPVSGSRPA